MDNQRALTVSQLNSYIKMLMDSDEVLATVALRGEISNFKLHSSGHMYFTLKDESSEIMAVMFRASAARLNFTPKVGSRVVAYGKVGVYEASGRYHLYVSAMTDDGAGALWAEYQRLLVRLRDEGLFDEARKKPIPKFARRVGVVTSITGAAIRDIINVTGRRYPQAELVISPSLVQGDGAPDDLVRALELLDVTGDCDVIIIGRGGGSAEDLWAFNNERVVRAVAAANTPIISAVGHQTDTTLCDFAADLRAPTPSAAAEQAVPDRFDLLNQLDALCERLDSAVDAKIDKLVSTVTSYSQLIYSSSPEAKLRAVGDRIQSAHSTLDLLLDGMLERCSISLAALAQRLQSVNPLDVMSRGYGIVYDGCGHVLTCVDGVSQGDAIDVRVLDGNIRASVTSVQKLYKKEELGND